MKNIIITLSLAFLFFSCNDSDKTSDVTYDEISVAELLQEKVESGDMKLSTQVVKTFTPKIIDRKGKDTAGPPGDDGCGGECCCTCEGNLTLHLPTIPEGCQYQVELYEACSANINATIFSFNANQLGVWTNNPNSIYYTTDTSFDFEIIDEHFYFVLAYIIHPNTLEPCTLDASITDGINGNYKFTLNDLLTVGAGQAQVLMLHCDDISYSECWNGNINNDVGGPRECCI